MGRVKQSRPASGVLALAVVVVVLATAAAADERVEVPSIRPEKRELIEFDEFTGRFEAIRRAEVRPRVSGFIEEVVFQEGQAIEKGDLLVVIDRRPFQIALDAARAQLAEAVALRDLARIEAERARGLLAARTISQDRFDELSAEQTATAARVANREAAVADAALRLEWTEVRAPISGRVGSRMVDEGNLISGGDAGGTLLTTIVQEDPIYFVFEASEADYLKYTRLDERGVRPTSRSTPNAVSVRLLDEDEFLHHGVMDFVDNELDPTSGTLQGRAVLANPNLLIQPGAFGRLRLQGSGLYEAIVIPDEVVQFDQSRQFVFVVEADGTAGRRFIERGPLVDEGRIVRSGLTGDERVIAGGFHRVRVGTPVEPVARRGDTAD